MENVTWTDDRLGERFDAIDKRFDAIDQRFEAVDQRFEAVDRRFNRIESEILELRCEMRAGFESLQTTLNRVGGGLLIALGGVIAAVLVKGA